MAVSEQVLATIKKLFALSNNNPNESEAETAMLKAQELLAKHQLSLSDLDRDQVSDDVITLSADDRDALPWKYRLASIIANNFRCKTFSSARKCTRSNKIDKRSVTTTIFLGHPNDVAIAKEVFIFAKHKAMMGANKWYARVYNEDMNRYGYAKNTKGIKGDYIKGFLLGLNERFKKQVDEKGWGLVLITPQDVVDVFNERQKNFQDGKSTAMRVRGNETVKQAGFNDGLKFTHSKQIKDNNK